MEEEYYPSDCPGLEVLDFRPNHPCFNQTDTTPCEEAWPCEVRLFWLKIYPFVSFTRGFLSYGSLVIIIIGVLLNTLSFYVLTSSGLSKNGSGIYLLTLAICDSGNLLANILIGVVRGFSEEFNEYFLDNEWLCRTHGVLVELFQTISAWIVVAFTVERSLAVWYPMLFRQRRNKRANIVVATITTIFTLFCLTKLFVTGFERDSVFGYIPCNSHRFVWEGYSYVRIAFQTWIPTIVVFIFNCLMFYKLKKIKRQRKRLTEHIREPPIPMSSVSRRRNIVNKSSTTNPMLIAVSLSYLVLVCPLGTVQSVELYWSEHCKITTSTEEPYKAAYVNWLTWKILLKYMRSFCFGFYQLNFAINFFLYFAAGVEFRRYLQTRVRHLGTFLNLNICRIAKSERKQQNSGTSGQSCASTGTGVSMLPAPSDSFLAPANFQGAVITAVNGNEPINDGMETSENCEAEL